MKFTFRGPLLRFVEFQREVDMEVEAPTVRASLDALVARYPGLKPVLLDANGQVRTAHRLFLNSQMITRNDLNRPVSSQDRVDILTAVAGG
jgi:molybdopterin converting factor small subunit